MRGNGIEWSGFVESTMFVRAANGVEKLSCDCRVVKLAADDCGSRMVSRNGRKVFKVRNLTLQGPLVFFQPTEEVER
jgi:hypothetical protein